MATQAAADAVAMSNLAATFLTAARERKTDKACGRGDAGEGL